MSDIHHTSPTDSAVPFEQALVYAGELAELSRPDEGPGSIDLRFDAEARRRILRLLEDGGPNVVFQPICSLTTFETVGVEALARFPRDEEGLPPDRWFLDAARAGLSASLERAAIQVALACHVNDPTLYLSVNASPDALLDGSLDETLAETEATLVIEITEHWAVDDYDALTGALEGFRRRGGRLAVDDAGAGFASLRHIVDLAPDIIKLDIGLTRGIDRNASRRAMARALIAFAEETNTTIVAEGIETERELLTLVDLGVQYGQGYRLARPMAPRALEQHLRTA